MKIVDNIKKDKYNKGVKKINTKEVVLMKPNVESLQNLIDSKFNGNKSAFAKTIGIERSHVSKVISTGACAGATFFGALLDYCKRENLNFEDYIF